MPKKSNEFQRLVAFIYDCIKPDGGTVTESAMVVDREANTEREVDILVENKVAGHQIKIAIECRDRSRKESVEWVDSIIGKVKSLDLNKVVAVSSEGFPRMANWRRRRCKLYNHWYQSKSLKQQYCRGKNGNVTGGVDNYS